MNFSLKKNKFELKDVFLVQISPSLISVLKQTRTTMSKEGISELFFSIKKNGQKTPGDVFAFKEEKAITYLNNLNKLWGTEYDIKKLSKCWISEKSSYYFLFLIAGHRRYRVCRDLNCEYLANIHFEKTFEEAIQWQLEENLHEEIPLIDLINSINSLWLFKKNQNPKLTLKDFSKKSIFKSLNWVYNALKFNRLPVEIQELLRETDTSKGVNYSILLQFASLYDFSVRLNKPLSSELLLVYITHCLVHKYKLAKVKDFCKLRKEELLGQQILFTLQTEEVNQSSLATIRRYKSLYIADAERYLENTPRMINQITKFAKRKAANILKLGEKIQI